MVSTADIMPAKYQHLNVFECADVSYGGEEDCALTEQRARLQTIQPSLKLEGLHVHECLQGLLLILLLGRKPGILLI